ncbi:lantibiotic dehydratase [Streptacidiphilus sp. N1-12]|uniref:Lantibiotic dehydratase n=2 Tax=Streptacidiphilus alkalitolerans TaxID=3342712 RepID=A0ABV6WQU4_9ACTN
MVTTHNTSTCADAAGLLCEGLADEIRKLSKVGRTPLAVDLRMDAEVELPASMAEDLERAASALLRLSRHPFGRPMWQDWTLALHERYGNGALVPLAQALNPDAGVGYPATYPGSTIPAPAPEAAPTA